MSWRRTPLKTSLNTPAPRKRKTKSDLAKAKAKLWELCKTITRLRYGNTCYTCNKTGLEGSNWHTGHYVTKSTCSAELAYDLRNLRPQCYQCNINLSGNWVAFEHRLVIDCGQSYVNDLKRRNRDTKGRKFDILWYQRKAVEYTRLLELGVLSPSIA